MSAPVSGKNPLLSIVVPLYNEAESVQAFHQNLAQNAYKTVGNSYELIYVSDGSTDKTVTFVTELSKSDKKIKLITLSRNFGKENALSAGLHAASGSAIMMIDGDGQHPPSYLPKFYEEWKKGSKVVIGIRENNSDLGFIKSKSSMLFHKAINLLSDEKLIYGTTDFRLIDSTVRDEIIKLPETDRVMRALIDWIGFKRSYIGFHVEARLDGKSSFTNRALLKHAMNSFAALTPKPLYFVGYLGVIITILSLIAGVAVIVEQLVLDDPLKWNFTGTAMLAILLLFLVGLVLTAQGILSVYISHMHKQTLGRPLYVIDYSQSVGIKK